MELTTAEVAELVGGRHVGPATPVRSIVLDHRDLGGTDGPLFVGARYRFPPDDTNRHVTVAAARGVPYLTEWAPVGGTAIVVPDSEEALLALAGALRDRLEDRVIAITGSVGKTTTRALTEAAVATRYQTVATARSHNNELSVPATLLRAEATTECVVVELGARYRHQIARLAAVVKPTVGVLLHVGEAHLGTFGSREAIAVTKTELVTGLARAATAVVPASPPPLVAPLLTELACPALTYGDGGDVVAAEVRIDDTLGLEVVVDTPWGRATARPPCRGRHNVDNVLASLAAAAAVGVAPDVAAAAMSEAQLEAHRSIVTRRDDGLVVLDDTYNATPSSVAAALRALVEIPARRHVAVLGPIDDGPLVNAELHSATTQLARELGVELLAFKAPLYGLPTVTDPGEIVAQLTDGDDTAVLVKGSRSARTERVVEALLMGDESSA